MTWRARPVEAGDGMAGDGQVGDDADAPLFAATRAISGKLRGAPPEGLECKIRVRPVAAA
jgi:hypothetical protein